MIANSTQSSDQALALLALPFRRRRLVAEPEVAAVPTERAPEGAASAPAVRQAAALATARVVDPCVQGSRHDADDTCASSD